MAPTPVTPRRAASTALQLALAPLALLFFGGSALRQRLREHVGPPRVVWGPTPIISIAHWSHGLRERGYTSTTVVRSVYAINQRDDFDVVIDELRPKGVLRPLRPYLVFARLLRDFDVFQRFFSAGYLGSTPLDRFELPLLRLAAKVVIVSPYGSDVAVKGTLGPFEQSMFESYPGLERRAEEIRQRVDRTCRWATLVIRNLQPGYVPRCDFFWPTQVGIDADEWRSVAEATSHDGRNGTVRIAHSSNHRAVKGTQSVIDAVERLRGEGLLVELDLLEGLLNRDVRVAIERADIVVDQLVAGYGLAAIEAMSLGRPVLSRISWIEPDVRGSVWLAGCPLVDADAESVTTRLRELVVDPELRRRLGRAGRTFVLQRHSANAVSLVWEQLISHATGRGPLPAGPEVAIAE